MSSLRRPSAAIQARPSYSNTRAPMVGDSQRKGEARKSKVGDKIKKRMSMRYAGGDQVSAAPPPLPGQPSAFLASDPYQTILPDIVRSSSIVEDEEPIDEEVGESRFGMFGNTAFSQNGFGGGQTSIQEERIRRRGAADLTIDEWDLEELHRDAMDINAFLRKTLTGADEEELTRFKAALMRQKQSNAKELQRSVFKHYAEFVVISKEISTLESDMLELKELLGQWKDLPQLMGMGDTLAPTLDKNGNLERRRSKRNSVADLQQMYKTQLTNLWSTVEGSQKYLPVIPGRHLVFETHNFVELNAATYKAKQSVSMFLLNDLLLIAGRRRMKNSPALGSGEDKERERGRTVAERCWVLADLVVVDVKDSGDLTNALKIRRNKEVCIYRTAKPEDKKALLAAFRQVSQELGEKKRKDNEKEQERRKSIWQGDAGISLSDMKYLLTTRSDCSWQPRSTPPGIIEPRPTVIEYWYLCDRLKRFAGLGRGGEASGERYDHSEEQSDSGSGQDLLKKVSANPSAHDLLTARLDQLRPNLVSQMAHDLSSPEIRKTKTARLVSLLSRLDHADLARDNFLKARRDIMLKRVRSIKCEGDISIYISELAIVCFTVIRHTSDWFVGAFKETQMVSGFITWAKEQIETFADLFRRQVYAATIEDGIADECIRVTASHNRKLLRDIGLDFTFLLSTLLRPDPSSTSLPHPVFQVPLIAATPAPGYHIEPSPFIPYVLDDLPPEGPYFGATAPLSINPRSPRKPRTSDALSPGLRPASPAPPPRSARRAVTPVRSSTETSQALNDVDSLR